MIFGACQSQSQSTSFNVQHYFFLHPLLTFNDRNISLKDGGIRKNRLEIIIGERKSGWSLEIKICWNVLEIYSKDIGNILEIIILEKSLAGPWQSATAKQIAPQIPVNLSPNPCHLIGKITNYSIFGKKIDYPGNFL